MTPRPASFVARVVFLAPLAWSVSTARAADPDPGKPNIAHNSARAHNDMVERVSESRRAYPLYKQGDSLLKPWKGGPGGAPVTDAPSPGQHNWDAVVAWVTENAEAAGVIRDAASRDTLDVPWISPNRFNKTGKPDDNPIARPAGSVHQPSAGPANISSRVSGKQKMYCTRRRPAMRSIASSNGLPSA
jgi:hypothetical protein